MSFRRDINFLRAVAVTFVILFHYGVGGFTGGYVGVDVFFVISGYLMTKIIVAGIDAGRFSLLGFYRARLLRIVPPLLGMALAILIFGYVFVDAETYLRAAKEIMAALTFTSNILFWREAGYFDPRSDAKVLLHTWSLSAEWQFYVLYPLGLILIARLRLWNNWLVPLMWLACVASLVLCIGLSRTSAQAAFFLIPTRMWEMIAGGLVLLHIDRAGRQLPYPRAIAAIGLGLILISTVIFDKMTLWPSYHALLPVIGTCLVIAARASSRLADNPVADIVGNWSYSIYLWHWPILIYASYVSGTHNVPLGLLLLAAVIGCAALARKLIAAMQGALERPLAFPHAPKTWTTLACIAALTATAAAVVQSDGATWRHKDYARYAALYREAHRGWSFPPTCSGVSHGKLRLCKIGDSDNRTLVIGDSHAEQLYPRFLDYVGQGHAVTFATMRGCPPIPGIEVAGDSKCHEFAKLAFDLARDGHFTRVIISAMWNGYIGDADGPALCFVTPEGCVSKQKFSQGDRMMADALSRYAARLKEITDKGTPVIILGPEPTNTIDLPMELLRRDFLGRDKTDLVAGISRRAYDKESIPTLKRLLQVAADSGSRFINPDAWLCNGDRCPTLDASGRPEFVDSNHFTSRAVTGVRFSFVDKAMEIEP